MIRELRQRHLRMMVVLAIVVPIVLFGALVARRRFPTMPLPPALTAETSR